MEEVDLQAGLLLDEESSVVEAALVLYQIVESLCRLAQQRFMLCLCPSTIIESHPGSKSFRLFSWTVLSSRKSKLFDPKLDRNFRHSWRARRGSWFGRCIFNGHWPHRLQRCHFGHWRCWRCFMRINCISHLCYPTGHRAIRMEGLGASDPLECAGD